LSDRKSRITFDVIKKFEGLSKCSGIQTNNFSLKDTYKWFAIFAVMFMKKTVFWA